MDQLLGATILLALAPCEPSHSSCTLQLGAGAKVTLAWMPVWHGCRLAVYVASSRVPVVFDVQGVRTHNGATAIVQALLRVWWTVADEWHDQWSPRRVMPHGVRRWLRLAQSFLGAAPNVAAVAVGSQAVMLRGIFAGGDPIEVTTIPRFRWIAAEIVEPSRLAQIQKLLQAAPAGLTPSGLLRLVTDVVLVVADTDRAQHY
mmetsp:Transcript_97084/g.190644  ORF Transcript_97084/g.190644 Transcript_97084/m.190644 type:complete len:202 (+) Transcript_97084:2-607(+)